MCNILRATSYVQTPETPGISTDSHPCQKARPGVLVPGDIVADESNQRLQLKWTVSRKMLAYVHATPIVFLVFFTQIRPKSDFFHDGLNSFSPTSKKNIWSVPLPYQETIQPRIRLFLKSLQSCVAFYPTFTSLLSDISIQKALWRKRWLRII